VVFIGVGNDQFGAVATILSELLQRFKQIVKWFLSEPFIWF